MSRNFVEGIKVRTATREEILRMGDVDTITILDKTENSLEVQGENSSTLMVFNHDMGRVGTFKKIDSYGDAIVIFGDEYEEYFPEELLTIVEDESELPTESELLTIGEKLEKSDKKLIRFENVEPYFKLSDEQIKLLYVLYEYGLLNESFNFADEVEVIEV
jgi:hypothetical protein